MKTTRARSLATALATGAAAVSITVCSAGPALAADTITVPTLTAPTLTSPTLTTPQLTTPTVSVPQLTVPQLTVPQLTSPQLTVPQLTTPTLSVPQLTVPQVQVPQLQMPTLTMPTLQLPTLQLPTLPGSTAADVARSGNYGLQVVVTLPTAGGKPTVGAVDSSALVAMSVPTGLGRKPGKSPVLTITIGSAYAVKVTGLPKGTHAVSVLAGGGWMKIGTVKVTGKTATLPGFSAAASGTYLVKVGKAGKARYLTIVVQ